MGVCQKYNVFVFLYFALHWGSAGPSGLGHLVHVGPVDGQGPLAKIHVVDTKKWYFLILTEQTALLDVQIWGEYAVVDF